MKMKNKKTQVKWVWGSALMFAVLIFASWFNQGCVGGVPILSAMVVTATPTLQPNVVSNFETGTTSLNSTLLNIGAYGGSFGTNTYGGSPPNSMNNPFVVANTIPDANNGSSYAIHIFAPLTTTAGGYEADQLVCNFLVGAPSPFYDLTPFTGIRMDIAFGNDTNPSRSVAFPIDLTTPSSTPGGNCSTWCYNSFQKLLPAGTNTGWMPVTYTWSQFAQAYNPMGTPFTSHLNKVLNLSFGFGANTASGGVSTYTDFWVDNIQFIP